MATTAAQPTIGRSLGASVANGLRTATPAILFSLRLWASVCLALWVAFALQLNEPSWAATTAALVCQPVLGASLRKASFRLIGTVVGAVAIVVIAAYSRQDRASFLASLALWCAACAFVATVLRNYAAYAAALAGYTAAILAIDVLGPVGASQGSVTMFAIYRAIEICIGIVSAGVVLALTDLGHSQRKLATELASLTATILNGFTDCFVTGSPDQSRLRPFRREVLRRVVALDPMIDSAIGESSDLRYRSRALQQAVAGLMETASAWRRVAFAIETNVDPAMAEEAGAVHMQLPQNRLPPSADASAPSPVELRRRCCAAARSLVSLKTQTPRQRFLADSAATGMIGMSRALNGLTLVVDPREAIGVRGLARLHVPDMLPAFVNALRAFATVAVVSLFWIASAWPNGVTAITFAAVIVVLLPLQGDQAYDAAATFFQGCLIALVCAAIAVFGILPIATSFPGLCLTLGLALVPFGFLMALPWRPFMCMAAGVNFLPMLSLTNRMTFNSSGFWNSNLAILAGIGVAMVAFRLAPPVPPAIRARRLLALTLADLRRLARRSRPGALADWEGRSVARLLAMPDAATPVQRAEIVSMIAVGKEILRLRLVAPRFIPTAALGAALDGLAEGRSRQASEWLMQVDRQLASLPLAQAGSRIVQGLRANILMICDQLREFAACYDGEPTQ